MNNRMLAFVGMISVLCVTTGVIAVLCSTPPQLCSISQVSDIQPRKYCVNNVYYIEYILDDGVIGLYKCASCTSQCVAPIYNNTVYTDGNNNIIPVDAYKDCKMCLALILLPLVLDTIVVLSGVVYYNKVVLVRTQNDVS